MAEAGRLPIGGEERLRAEERRLERLLLSLRLADGVPADAVDPSRAQSLLDEGLMVRRNGHLALTDGGMFLANEIVLELAN